MAVLGDRDPVAVLTVRERRLVDAQVAADRRVAAAVDVAASIDEVFQELTGTGGAVLVGQAGRPVAIVTRSDLLEFLAAQRTQVET